MGLLDFFMPRRCAACGRRLASHEDALCLPCALRIKRYGGDFLRGPMAQRFWGQADIWKAAAWLCYQAGGACSHIVVDMKYHGKDKLCRVMGQIMADAMNEQGFFEGIDTIVPVPLAKVREKARGYNQSALLAKGASDITGLPVESRAVERLSFRQSQTKLGRAHRMDNVDSLFRLVRPELLAGRSVVLIDDVCTTGATMIACAKAVQIVAAKVSALAFSATRI